MARSESAEELVGRLLDRVERLERKLGARDERVAELEARIAELEKALEAAQRAEKRQAAPFSKGDPKADPKKPGRKPGSKYGRQGVPPIPEPDETIEVPCPELCSCGGRVAEEGTVDLYQIDIPAIVRHTRKFVVHYGRCVVDGERVQGQHPLLTSKAFEVGRVHFGPRIVALGAFLKVVGGMSYGKIQKTFTEMLGFPLARSSICRAVGRLGRRGKPTYQALIQTLRTAPIVYADETGWKVGGKGRWLWVATDKTTTVYRISPGRGYADAVALLGADFDGVLGVDGWAPYRRFKKAVNQTCNSHLLRRCHEMLETAHGDHARFPAVIKDILKHGLHLRDRRDEGRLTPAGLAVARGRLEARMDRAILEGDLRHPANLRFAKHLVNYRNNLFVYLGTPGVEATNWPAEQAIRPAVINRKTAGGGNRTDAGAEALAIVMSIVQTARHLGRQVVDVLGALLRGDSPTLTPAPPR
jgi:transposase